MPLSPGALLGTLGALGVAKTLAVGTPHAVGHARNHLSGREVEGSAFERYAAPIPGMGPVGAGALAAAGGAAGDVAAHRLFGRTAFGRLHPGPLTRPQIAGTALMAGVGMAAFQKWAQARRERRIAKGKPVASGGSWHNQPRDPAGRFDAAWQGEARDPSGKWTGGGGGTDHPRHTPARRGGFSLPRGTGLAVAGATVLGTLATLGGAAGGIRLARALRLGEQGAERAKELGGMTAGLAGATTGSFLKYKPRRDWWGNQPRDREGQFASGGGGGGGGRAGRRARKSRARQALQQLGHGLGELGAGAGQLAVAGVEELGTVAGQAASTVGNETAHVVRSALKGTTNRMSRPFLGEIVEPEPLIPLRRRGRRGDAGWQESEHPRGKAGRFAAGAGAGAAGAAVAYSAANSIEDLVNPSLQHAASGPGRGSVGDFTRVVRREPRVVRGVRFPGQFNEVRGPNARAEQLRRAMGARGTRIRVGPDDFATADDPVTYFLGKKRAMAEWAKASPAVRAKAMAMPQFARPGSPGFNVSVSGMGGTLPHELGHVRIAQSRIGRPLDLLGMAAPLARYGGIGAAALADPDSNASKLGIAATAASALPTLAHEAGASVLGYRGLQRIGASAQELRSYRRAMVPAFGTYALGAAVPVAAAFGARAARQGLERWRERRAGRKDRREHGTARNVGTPLPGFSSGRRRGVNGDAIGSPVPVSEKTLAAGDRVMARQREMMRRIYGSGVDWDLAERPPGSPPPPPPAAPLPRKSTALVPISQAPRNLRWRSALGRAWQRLPAGSLPAAGAVALAGGLGYALGHRRRADASVPLAALPVFAGVPVAVGALAAGLGLRAGRRNTYRGQGAGNAMLRGGLYGGLAGGVTPGVPLGVAGGVVGSLPGNVGAAGRRRLERWAGRQGLRPTTDAAEYPLVHTPQTPYLRGTPDWWRRNITGRDIYDPAREARKATRAARFARLPESSVSIGRPGRAQALLALAGGGALLAAPLARAAGHALRRSDAWPWRRAPKGPPPRFRVPASRFAPPPVAAPRGRLIPRGAGLAGASLVSAGLIGGSLMERALRQPPPEEPSEYELYSQAGSIPVQLDPETLHRLQILHGTPGSAQLRRYGQGLGGLG